MMQFEGLKAWLPTEPMIFGLDRDPHILLPNGIRIVSDRNVSDIDHRSLWERLFSRPWTPLKKYKDSPRCYVVDGVAIVSWSTYLKLKNEPE